MYTTGFSVSAVTNQLIKQANWECQVHEMYSNYELLTLLLGQSTSVSTEYRLKCIQLKLELTNTLEQFMSELENDMTNSEVLKQAIFSKHVIKMQQLNQSVGVLISQQTYS
jgi:hypothetical protein